MLEYLALDQFRMNKTGGLNKMNATFAEDYKLNMQKNLNETVKLVD